MDLKRSIFTLHINITYMPFIYVISSMITVGFLIVPALYNGYPLTFSDTGTYIFSGFAQFVPVDRPLGYGLFIYALGKQINSLWVVIIIQALFVLWVSHLFINLIIPSLNTFFFTSGILILLSFLTGVSNYTSILIPDIFTPLSLMSVAVLLFRCKLSLSNTLWLSLMIIFSCTLHFSNLLLIVGAIVVFFLVLFVTGAFRAIINRKKIIVLTTTIFLSWIAMPIVHYIHGKDFVWSRATNVIIMGRLMESGVLKKYLNDKCPEPEIELCGKRSKIKQYAYQFLWDNDSPLYDSECLKKDWSICWIEKDKEYALIIKDMMFTPKYLGMFSYDSFINSMRQLFTFGIVDIASMNEGSSVQGVVASYYPEELDNYKSTAQAKHTLTYGVKTLIQNIFVALSFVAICIIFFLRSFRNIFSTPINYFLIFVLIGLIVNAFICASFSGLVDRYQGRVIWIVPMIVLAMTVRYILYKRNTPITDQ